MNQKLKLILNKYHVMPNPSALINSHDIITLSVEVEGPHGRHDSAHFGDRKCLQCHTTAQHAVGDPVLILTIFSGI